MMNIIIGKKRHALKDMEDRIYVLNPHITDEAIFEDVKNGKEIAIKDGEFYPLVNNCNLDDGTMIFCFIYNNELIIGETEERTDGEDIDYFDINCEEVLNIPEEIKAKASKYCYYLFNDKYAKFN